MQDADSNRPRECFPATEHEFRRFLERLPVATYTCDPQGQITFFNAQAAKLWGREPGLHDSRDRFCGSFRARVPGGIEIQREESWMARALAENREFEEEEIIVQRPDGTSSTVLVTVHLFRDSSGTPIQALCALRDISDRKRTEEIFKDADRSKTQFLSLLAHELRNPLAPLRNGLQIIRLAPDDRGAVEEARAMMERQVGQMVHLIDELLDLSRVTNGKIELRPERLDLALAIVDAVEACRPLIDSSGHHLSVAVPSQPIYVEADRTRLAQAFTNLLNNSARYTLRGGHIRLNIEAHGQDAIISFSDNGIGIPPERLPRIFDVFSPAAEGCEHSKGGLGIGLNLVRALVELHGGHVTAHSDGCGAGADFIVRLPIAKPLTPAMTLDDDDADGFGGANYRILIVDDNIDSAISLTLMLKMMGHETKTVHDGISAIEAANEFRPDVILLDIGLPELSGYEVCRRIRAESWGKNIVIVAQTGWGQDEDRRKSKEMGFNFHLVKPIDPLTLSKVLAGLLQAA